MHICFVVEGYPTPKNPTMTFVRELVVRLSEKGLKCSVIAPQSIVKALKPNVPLKPRRWVDKINENIGVDVYQPYYLTFSGYTKKLNKKSMEAAIKRTYKKIKVPVDALYGHFWHMGVLASKIKTDIPVFVACGESKISVIDSYSKEEIESLIERMRGVIYVGTKSYNESLQLGLQRDSFPFIVAPNGYDPNKFKVLDKLQCRRELGWNENDFIISFVGNFDSRKGFDRMNEALKSLDKEGEKVYSCFIGRGTKTPDCPNVLHCGTVSHSDIVKYLNATDAFVLPTNNEGCCNAIVEAIGCGLPVISSNQEFNDDILDTTCSIRLDPMDINAIADAIKKMKNDNILRESLSDGAKKKACELLLDTRAQRIYDFIIANVK